MKDKSKSYFTRGDIIEIARAEVENAGLTFAGLVHKLTMQRDAAMEEARRLSEGLDAYLLENETLAAQALRLKKRIKKLKK